MRRTRSGRGTASVSAQPVQPPVGGRLRPLTKAAEAHIADTALAILDRIGMAGATGG